MSPRLKTAIGIILSVLLLGWALRDVSFGDVVRRIAAADPIWFLLSILVSLGGFWFRAVRWGFFLAPVAPGLPLWPRTAATFIGFAANNVLPARIGEFARALSLSRLTQISSAAAFAGLVLERIFDGLILVGMLFFAMASREFPGEIGPGGADVQGAALLLAGVMALTGLVLFLAMMRPRIAAGIVHLFVGRFPARVRDPVLEMLRSFARGLEAMKNPRLFTISLALALGQWVFLALSFHLGLRAFQIDDVPFVGSIFLQSLISLAVAIPSSPGFFGPFEAASRIGLGIWGVPAEPAISFAIGYHIGGFLPVTLIGLYLVWKTRLGWSTLRRSEEVVESVARDPEPPSRAITRNL